MRTILFLGAATYLIPSIVSLAAAGFRVVTVDRDPAAPGHSVAAGSIFASVDDLDSLRRAVATEHAGAIVPGIEAGVLAAAVVSEDCGICGIGSQVARNCTDKLRMRARWKSSNLRQPEFMSVTDRSTLHAALTEFGLPLVVKPSRSGGSKGVSVVMKANDIDPAIHDACAVDGDEYIVERFIAGPLLTADGFVKDGEVQIVLLGDVDTAADSRYRVNMSLNYPGDFSAATLTEARGTISAAVGALGLNNSAFHCECIVGADGVYLVELAARTGGSYIGSRIAKIASGLDAPVVFAKLLLGEKPDIEPTYSRGATLRFVSAPAGVVASVEGLDRASKLPGILEVGVHVTAGKRAEAVTHDNARHGFIVATGATRNEAVSRAQAASESIVFRMEEAVARA